MELQLQILDGTGRPSLSEIKGTEHAEEFIRFLTVIQRLFMRMDRTLVALAQHFLHFLLDLRWLL